MAVKKITPEIAALIRDEFVQSVSAYAMADDDAARALKVNGVLQGFMKSKLLLMQYLEERSK